MNLVILIGNLGDGPELRKAGDQSVCTFRLATSRKWKDRQSGQKREATEWHTIEAWGAQADACGKNLLKGHQVSVRGRLQTDQWIDKQSGARRERTKVVAEEVKFLHRSSRSAEAGEDAVADIEVPPLPVD